MTSLPGASSVPGEQPLARVSPIGFGTAAADAEGMNFADVVRIIKQRKITIIVTTFVLYLLVVAGTFAILRFAPLYSSEAIFELDPPKTGDFIAVSEAGFDTRTMEQLLQTESRKLKSLGLLMDVVKHPEVKNTSYYRWYNSNAPDAAFGLQDDLRVGPIPDTRLIRVMLATRNREESRTIVFQIVDLYRKQFIDESRETRRTQVDLLKNTLTDLEDSLATKQQELTSVRETNDLPAMEMERITSREYIAKLKADLSDLDARSASLQAQLDTIQTLNPDELPLTADQQLIIESDPMLRLWRSKVEEIDIELEAMLERLGPNHRDIKQVVMRRRGFEEKETAQREELIGRVRTRQREGLEQESAQTQTVQARIQTQFIEARAQERDLDRSIQRYFQLDEARKRAERLIEKVEGELAEARHAQRDDSRSRLRLVQHPELAVEPSRPDLLTYLSGGVLLALAGGFGLAFLREFTDKTLRTPIDVARFGHVSVLGSVPLLHDEEAEEVEEIEDAVRKAPHSLVAEAFRKVRTNLQFSGPEETQRVMLLTSPSPGDGKTAVAVNLAYTLANSNQRVLLIDCNFRRPAIRSLFSETQSDGLSNILVGRGKLEDLVTKTDNANLDVLSSGPMPPTPAELLGSKKMRELLEQATRTYDRVLLDGPPVLLISDAIVLAGQVSGVILVARAEDNTKGTLKRAREQLEGINVRVIGAVLNGVKARAGGYFRRTYREFYDYVSDETIPAELPGPMADDEGSADAK